MSEPEHGLYEFIQECLRRMAKGKKEYGGIGFTDHTMLQNLNDIDEELMDAVNYCFMLHFKIQKLRRAISAKKWQEVLDEENARNGSEDDGDPD